jgi:hypothetical protein
MTSLILEGPVWPLWRKIAFRFAFIYLVLYTTPWALAVNSIPYVGNYAGEITQFYDIAWDWLVRAANAQFFHIAENLVPFNGSGDTSFGWAQLWLTLCLAAIGCIIWSAIDRKRNNYEAIDYWLRVCVRYYISFFCLSYGIIKIFSLQMIFPNVSQLATPLGDFLPMRFSWLFIGYSTPYQMFSGVMETLAGLLLINRKTVTLGLVTATGVFMHVFVLNLAYDIPVKLFSGHLLLLCVYLLMYELPRLINFFILNRVSEPDTFFNLELNNRWLRYGRIVAKLTFVIVAFAMPVYNTYNNSKQFYDTSIEPKPIKDGLYDIELFVKNNKDTIPPLVTDSTRWKNIVFERNGSGSVDAHEPLFFQRYRRWYFNYKPDTTKNIVHFTPFRDTTKVLSMKYDIPDENTIHLWSKYKGDSLYLKLRRSKRHFQLTERQFHWLSEANR